MGVGRSDRSGGTRRDGTRAEAAFPWFHRRLPSVVLVAIAVALVAGTLAIGADATAAAVTAADRAVFRGLDLVAPLAGVADVGAVVSGVSGSVALAVAGYGTALAVVRAAAS
ncbi:hypothetical protein ACFQFH_09315 [Halobaculum halobium]|uniref:Uncharacterized protein n=1 Tax=Halobaculum halobium TaxID=3032281 RepID=A0ABD5TBX7_9EURY|nr:hypothetical protein [Halobaculum sp. SYNS20]